MADEDKLGYRGRFVGDLNDSLRSFLLYMLDNNMDHLVTRMPEWPADVHIIMVRKEKSDSITEAIHHILKNPARGKSS